MTAPAPAHRTPHFDARWLLKVLAVAAAYFATAWVAGVNVGWSFRMGRHCRAAARGALALIFLLMMAGMVLAQQDPGRPLIVGSEEDFPPFAIGKTDEAAGGFTVDLWKVVAAEHALKYTIRIRPFRQILEEFKAGKIDVMINLAQSEERRAFADFSVPHVIVHGAIFVRKGESRIHSEADFAGKSIIVLDADLAHDYAISKGWEKQLVLVDTAADGLKLLATGQHDAMLLSKLAGMQTLQGLKIRNVTALDSKAGFSQKFSFAVQKGNSELLAKINEGLAISKSTGAYDVLYQKWFGVFEVREVTFRQMLKYLGPIAIPLLIFTGIFLARQRERRKKDAAALRESEARFQTFMDHTPAMVIIKDAEGRYVYVNKTVENNVHATLEELRGKTNFDRLPHEVARQLRANDLEVLATGQAREFIESVPGPGGRMRHWLTSKFPIQNAAGETQIGVIAFDITERTQSEKALHELSRRLLEAEDEERRRIAKELHDSSAQDLVAVLLNLDRIQDAAGGENAATLLADSRAILENCVNDLRTLSYVLHPPRLDETGLPGALAEYAAGLDKRADVRIRTEAAPDFGRLPDNLELVLFRVAQEALGNVVRHSESDAATIRLARTDAGIVLEVEDYGRGMPAAEATEPGARGVGLAGMRERLEHLGGRLEIRWSCDGTTVRAVLPLKDETK